VIFAGIIKTTDGKKWSVGFEALSWEDAKSLAEDLGVDELGLCLGTTLAEDPDPYNLDDPESHLFAWHYRNGRLVNEDV